MSFYLHVSTNPDNKFHLCKFKRQNKDYLDFPINFRFHDIASSRESLVVIKLHSS